jgi:2'-5' RNA ligase
VIYEALRRSRQRNLAALRENIRAEITRLGFPDIDVEPFFAPCTLTKAEIVELANALLSAGRTPANQK